MLGKKYMGVNRSTVIIDPKGKVARVFPKVSPAEHPIEVEATLKVLQQD